MVAWNGRDEIEKLAKTIKGLQDQITALAAAPTTIPNVDTDPASTAIANVWIFNDNRLRIRKRDGTVREVVTTAPGASTSGSGQPAVPAQLAPHRDTWAAAWSQTYRSNGAQRSESLLHVGSSGDSFNGSQTALIGWPYAAIQTALAGSVIQVVEIYVYATHCYWNGGSTIYFASQANTAAPGTLSGINSGAFSSAHVRGSDQGGEPDDPVGGGGRWKRVDNTFGAMLRAGTMLGTALVPASSNPSFYAILGGVGSGVPAPQLRISYLK